mmetsp:Transcript_30824/g.97191  ORF Transcript_30824/g.97191 Transcript_30824/m.97191 type:complete len:287 (-) Transcript_30824:90-950(-)
MAASHTSLRQKRARAHLALHTAVRRYNVPQIKALIEEGAELTEVDEFGRTPLHLAVVAASQSHHQPNGDATVREMVSALLAGDVEALCEVLCLHSDAGLTPLHLAARCGNSGLMGLLLDSIDEEVLSDVMEMRTQLTGDLYSGNWGKKDADTGELGELDIEHMTLLHLALERLDPKEDEDDDPVPLTAAARAEAVELVKTLLRRGADANARDHYGGTPLNQAVGAGLHDMAELLCSAGADPAATGCKPIGTANTVLHQAATRGDGEMIRLLLRLNPHLDVGVGGQA